MAIDGFDDSAKARLSALVDGELDPAASAASCAAWSRDAELRVEWHAWHLIGDVLRSEDLASDPGRDRRFCAAVGARLRNEAVVLAPGTHAVPGDTRATPAIDAASPEEVRREIDAAVKAANQSLGPNQRALAWRSDHAANTRSGDAS